MLSCVHTVHITSKSSQKRVRGGGGGGQRGGKGVNVEEGSKQTNSTTGQRLIFLQPQLSKIPFDEAFQDGKFFYTLVRRYCITVDN